jgi:chloramphenicol 3-O-phosphotransferase
VSPDIILLNGGSSSGTSTQVRELQLRLPDPWRAVGVDTFIAALPPRRFDRDRRRVHPAGELLDVRGGGDGSGMARRQAAQVHQRIGYDLEVDTTDVEPATAVAPILTAVTA